MKFQYLLITLNYIIRNFNLIYDTSYIKELETKKFSNIKVKFIH